MGLEMIGVFRKEKKMTIDELSERSGVPVSTIKKISAGITTDPNLSTIQSIASALGCSVDDFSDSSTFGNMFSFEEKKMVKKYRALDWHGKEMVDIVLDKETERMEAERKARATVAVKERQNQTEVAEELPTPVSKDGQDKLDKEIFTLYQGLMPGQKRQILDLMQGMIE